MNLARVRSLRRSIAVVAAVVVTTTAVARAANAAEAALPVAQDQLQVAIQSGAMPDLLKARAQFATLSAADPRSADLHYWTAIATWRVVPRLIATDKAKAEKLCKDGLEHSARALELNPKHAEAMALRASLLGLWLTFEPNAMMTIGPQIEETMARAVTLAPKNPRVRLFEGIGTLNKPAFIGGGPKPALERLQAAATLFEEEATRDSSRAAWGQDEAYLWAGRSAMKAGDAAGAAGWYRKALAVSPAYGWVRGVLLPEAEKVAAAADSARAGSASGASQ